MSCATLMQTFDCSGVVAERMMNGGLSSIDHDALLLPPVRTDLTYHRTHHTTPHHSTAQLQQQKRSFRHLSHQCLFADTWCSFWIFLYLLHLFPSLLIVVLYTQTLYNLAYRHNFSISRLSSFFVISLLLIGL